MFEISRWSEPADTEELPAGFNFIVGVDLGQSQDYTAICIIEKVGSGSQSQYHVRKLERARSTSYTQIVARARSIAQQLRGCTLVIDGTGVGRPVSDMFDDAGLRPIVVHIHGGDRVTHDEGEQAAGRARGWIMGASRRWGVPKRDLVGVLQVLLQNKRLKIAPGPLSDTLATEMLNFRVKIDPTTTHDSYSAWREGQHDDLVLATALGCWWGENKPHVPLASVYALRCARGSY